MCRHMKLEFTNHVRDYDELDQSTGVCMSGVELHCYLPI